jgi:predicted XRE-type DNA-binding protein
MRWKTIPNFSNYEVSECGQVRRSIHTNPRSRGWSRKKPGDILSPAKKKKYPSFVLVRDDGKYCPCHLHHLVATTFHGPRPKGLFALHRDDDGHHNHYKNIYWGTQAQNNADMYRNGHGLCGEKHPNCTITDEIVREIRDLYSTGLFTQQAIADKFEITQSAVSVFVRNKRRQNSAV